MLLRKLEIFLRVSFGLWIDEWPAVEADAGKTVLKRPATSATNYLKVLLPTPVATILFVSRATTNSW